MTSRSNAVGTPTRTPWVEVSRDVWDRYVAATEALWGETPAHDEFPSYPDPDVVKDEAAQRRDGCANEAEFNEATRSLSEWVNATMAVIESGIHDPSEHADRCHAYQAILAW